MLNKISDHCKSLPIDSRTSLLSLVVILLFWRLFSKDRSKVLLSKIPGPKAYPFIGNLPDLLVPRERLFADNVKRAKKYGTIFRMWLGSHPSVHVSDPRYVEEVLHSSKHLTKGFSYKFIKPFLGSGLITASGEKWQSHRKMLTPAFHFKILDSFFEVFREQGKILMDKLDEEAKTGGVFDIYKAIKLCALDVICEAAMGVKVNAQKSSHSEYVQSVLRISAIIVERITRLWLHPDIVFNMTKLGKEQKKHLEIVHNFVENVIRQRRNITKGSCGGSETNNIDKKPRLAFLDLLLESAAQEKLQLTEEDLREEVDTFMFAGHDTTTAAITWAIYLIGLHPQIQEDLYQEQVHVFENDMERPIKQEDLAKMNVLDRVMKESIRLYPSVPIISRKLEEDVKFGEYLVPQDTTVILQIYPMHRNPDIYPNPDKFDPDRFLPENVKERHSYAFVPFSAGPRNCIGKRFALFEEKFILASLIRRYVIESIEKPEELDLVGEMILRPLTGVKVTLKRRGGF